MPLLMRMSLPRTCPHPRRPLPVVVVQEEQGLGHTPHRRVRQHLGVVQQRGVDGTDQPARHSSKVILGIRILKTFEVNLTRFWNLRAIL